MRPLIWAHRGASGYLPENTLEAFQKAVDMGADGIELDVHKTKDGVLVVIHDEMIDRTSDGTGWVKDMTYDELLQYNYNRTHQESLSHATIPTLAQVFDLIKPTNLTINIELKTGIVFYENIEADTVALVREYGLENRVIYSSFNHASVLQVKKLDINAKVGFLYADGTLDMADYGEKYGVEALHPALYNLQYPGFVTQAKVKGLKLHTWTVNEEQYIKMCCKYGVDAIITNYPDVAVKVVDAMEM